MIFYDLGWCNNKMWELACNRLPASLEKQRGRWPVKCVVWCVQGTSHVHNAWGSIWWDERNEFVDLNQEWILHEWWRPSPRSKKTFFPSAKSSLQHSRTMHHVLLKSNHFGFGKLMKVQSANLCHHCFAFGIGFWPSLDQSICILDLGGHKNWNRAAGNEWEVSFYFRLLTMYGGSSL